MSDRIGIELPDVYDGVSVWIEADGTLTNRWQSSENDRHGDSIGHRRWRATQEWIDANKEKWAA